MSVFRETTIEFEGESYTLTPSNKLLRRIDAELSPQTLLGVLYQMDGREAPFPALACIISMLLNEGGGKFTEDDILAELYRDAAENNGEGIRPLMEAIAECISPGGSQKGNAQAPAPASEPSPGASDTKPKSRKKAK